MPAPRRDARPRLACLAVEEPALAILRQRRAPPHAPLAAVDRLGPTGTVLAACPRARRKGVACGTPLAAARARAPDLHAGAVSYDDLRRFAAALFTGLSDTTPFVEPLLRPGAPTPPPRDAPPTRAATLDAGTFFLDARGLSRLYGSADGFRHRVETFLRERNLPGTVIVGFHRLRVLALARRGGPGRVFYDPAEEARAAGALPLGVLPLDPRTRARLERLGIGTVGALAALPAAELRARFGPAAARLHERLHRDGLVPLAPLSVHPPVRLTRDLDPPDAHAERLVFLCKELIDEACRVVRRRLHTVAALRLRLVLDRPAADDPFGPRRTLRLRLAPAHPTLDAASLLDLVRLRLSALPLDGCVARIELTAETRPATPRQLPLVDRPTRDLAAARAALARVEAAFGPGAVTVAALRPDPVPHRRAVFVPPDLRAPPRPQPPGDSAPLVRRVLPVPTPIAVTARAGAPAPRRREPPAALGPAPPQPATARRPVRVLGRAVTRAFGPHRTILDRAADDDARDSFYSELDDGTIVWIAFDHRRKRWLLQGWVD